MKAKYLLLLLCAFIPFASWAEKDPVEIKSVKFDKVQRAKIIRSGGDWSRIEVVLYPNGSGSEWFRNIEVGLTLLYQNVKGASVGSVSEPEKDKKEKGESKAQDNRFVVFKSTAKLFAAKGGSATSVVFYVPWEAYDVYRISGDPFAWNITLKVDGSEIKLNKKNIRTMVSKNILKSQDPSKVYASFMEVVNKASQGNDGVVMPLPQCPYNVQYYEYEVIGGSIPVPSYIVTK